jgi:hypothetical protein
MRTPTGWPAVSEPSKTCTSRCVAAAGKTSVESAPRRDPDDVSVATTDCAPPVPNVTPAAKVRTPLSDAVNV